MRDNLHYEASRIDDADPGEHFAAALMVGCGALFVIALLVGGAIYVMAAGL